MRAFPHAAQRHDEAPDAPVRHAVAARRRDARSRDRRARDADLPDRVVRLSRYRSRGGAVQHGARRSRLLAHLQSRRARCSRSASPRSKAASAPSPRRAGRRRCTSRSPRCRAPASHIVASRSLYGGSHNLLDYTLPRFGIETTFVDPRDIDAWRAAIRPETRLLFGETLGNPGLDVLDIPRVAALAHEHGLPLLVDSTFTTPWLMQPFEHGADLVFHSATKFLSGHGVVIGGVLVDGGRFDWDARAGAREVPDADRAVRRLPRHGVRRGVDDGRVPAARAARRPARLRRVHGADDRVPDPAGHRDAAAADGEARREHAQDRRVPREHPLVGAIGYPELPEHPDHALAQRLLPRGCGAVFSFDLQGHARAGAQVHRDAEALLASRQRRRREIAGDPSGVDDALPDVAPTISRTAGITEGTIRLSVGLEDPDDLIEDLSRALLRGREGGMMQLESSAAGARLRVHRVARPFDAAQPTVVFVHGAANDHSVWALQSRYFAHHGCNVLAVDLPGHGRSAGPAHAIGRGARRLARRAARRRRRRRASRWSAIARRAGGARSARRAHPERVIAARAARPRGADAGQRRAARRRAGPTITSRSS